MSEVITGHRTVSCENCNASNSGGKSTMHTLMYGIRHAAGCSPIHSSGYKTFEKKQYTGEEIQGKLDLKGNVV